MREQLRNGSHQIKLFVSGGVTSPTDPIWMNQFTDSEILAAVEETATRRTYVMAHCHTDEAVRRCIKLGVRSIEHGTQIEHGTAESMAARDIYVVPTLSVIEVAQKNRHELRLPESSVEKLSGLFERMATSIAVCAEAGVHLGLGTDILSQEFRHLQGGELALRGEIQPAIDVLRSATSVNASLLKRSEDLGRIAPGALADILVLNGDPLKNLSLFRDPMNNPRIISR